MKVAFANSKLERLYLERKGAQAQGFMPPSAGWLLGQELEARRIKGKAKKNFLERAGLNEKQLQLVLLDQFPISRYLALFFEQEFEIPAGVWLQLENEMNSHSKAVRRGVARTGAGRKELGLKSRQLRISAKPEDMQVIESWLKHQSSAAQSVASLILDVAKPATRGNVKRNNHVAFCWLELLLKLPTFCQNARQR